MSQRPAKRNADLASASSNTPSTPTIARRPAVSNTTGLSLATPIHGPYETPVRPKEGEHTAVTVNNLSGRRLAAIEDAGPVHPEVPLANFFEYLLPLRRCLEEHSIVQVVVEKLKEGENPLLKHDTASDAYVWCDILSKKATKATEKVLFTTLEDIARRIEEIVTGLAAELGEELEPVVQYKDAPTTAPTSLNRTSKHIPDGYFILRIKQEEGPVDHWIDIGVVGEFKRGQGRNDTNKDVRQIIWDMHHILQEDDRRRFTLGFTIEANSMRLWYVNRADVFISQDFDFMTSPENLVRFFLAVTYSYEHQLGWDPTMEYVRASKNEPRHLLITAHSPDHKSKMVFKTLEMLSNIGTEAIRGRGTRVWRVEGVLEDGDPVDVSQTFVLKDSWIDSDREREGKILKKVRKSARHLPEDGKKSLLNALLTVKMYGDVWIDQDNTSGIEKGFYDCTFTTEQRSKIFPKNASLIRLQRPAIDDATAEQVTATQNQAKGNPHSAFQNYDQTAKPIAYDPKTHSRVVFYEACVPIHDERSLPRVCSALAAATTALQALHLAGWVHRDISSGNIMLWHDQVKITDFEFAKRFKKMLSAKATGDVRPHGNRSGTPNYTALEVVSGEFMFTRKATRIEPRSSEPPSSQEVVATPTHKNDVTFFEPTSFSSKHVIDPTGASGSAVQPPVEEEEEGADSVVWQYHPLHDVEALSWLCNQLTLNRDLYFTRAGYPEVEVYVPEGGETRDERPERIKRQVEAAKALRPGTPARTMCLTCEGYLKRRLKTTHPLLRYKPRKSASNSRSVVEALEEIRSCILETYKAASVDPSKITKSVAVDIYPIISEALDQASHSLRSSPAMINHIPFLRSLPGESYKVWKQDGVKDVNGRSATKTTQKAKGKAKATPSLPSGQTSTTASNPRAKAKAKATSTSRPSGTVANPKIARKRKRDATASEPEASTSKSTNTETATKLEGAQSPTQTAQKRKKRKTAA